LRASIREVVGDLFLVHARCSLDVAEARDPKSNYRAARARAGGTFPGVHVPYEEPTDADAVVDTSHDVPQHDVDRVVTQIVRRRAHDAS
jgi:adenylylsulfate kinase-like enzyme